MKASPTHNVFFNDLQKRFLDFAVSENKLEWLSLSQESFELLNILGLIYTKTSA